MKKKLLLLLPVILAVVIVLPALADTLPMGTVVTFGAYEQDDNTANGPEPIEWYVCEHDTAHNAILLLSRYVLDTAVFSDDIAWKDSELSAYLNGAFMDAAFAVEDQALIFPVMADAIRRNATSYKVFLPTAEQWQNLPASMKRSVDTPYCSLKQKAPDYWLMSDASVDGIQYVAVSDDDFNIDYRAPWGKAGIRPMLWVTLGDAAQARSMAMAVNAPYQALYEAAKYVNMPEFIRVEVVRGQKYPVYSAPSTKAWRGAKGKAEMSTNGEVLAACTDGAWTLIMYGTSNGSYRVGYVENLRGSSVLPLATWSGENAVITRKCNLIDDPVKHAVSITSLAVGTKVTYLASWDEWVYIETKVDKKTARGFVPMNSIEVK